jgi:hypothetical protein
MTTAADIAAFLSSDPGIAKVNFRFEGFPVYPTAYSKDLAGLLTAGRIAVVLSATLPASVGAQYYPQANALHLPVGFSFQDSEHISLLVHEMTHAHLDYHEVGWVSQDYGEAIAYLAEALFREHYGIPPISRRSLRLAAQSVAWRVMAGAYDVDRLDCRMLRAEVGTDPHYEAKTSLLFPRFHIYDGIP